MKRFASLLPISLFLFALSPADTEAHHGGPHIVPDADLDMVIYEGDNTDSPDCVIWEVNGASAQGGPASGDEGRLIATWDADAIYDAGGNPVCLFDGRKLLDLDGNEIFGVKKRNVFDLEILPLPDPTPEELLRAVVYNFKRRHIRDAPEQFGGEIQMTSTANVAQTSRRFKLTIAALAAGHCGSNYEPGGDAPAGHE